MALESIPLFSTLKSRLGYLTQREKLVAENVANSDTPGYSPRDLKPFALPKDGAAGAGKLAAATTSVRHISSQGASAGEQASIKAPDSETTLDGNQVVLEEQMMKMNEARMNYEAAIGFYQKSMSLLRMAARAPGR